MQYAFILGREFRLSLAELIHIFDYKNLREYNENFAIFELNDLSPKILQNLGGTTRIIEILAESSRETFPTDVIEYIENTIPKGKLVFSLAAFGGKMSLSEMGMRMKKTLSKNFSVRFLNAKDENIHSAVFKREKIWKNGFEFAFLSTLSHIKKENESDNTEKYYFWKTLACQDIDAYSRRDTGKNRDMITGMMPPKLVQMMMNLLDANVQNRWVYDPFCGLGTTLIEALNMGIYTIFGSDISEEMTENSQKSVKDFIAEEMTWQERIRAAGGTPAKDFSHIHWNIFPFDATKIANAFEKFHIPKNINIISEGYLGKIMRKESMTQDVVFSERRAISRMYESFFSELKKTGFHGQIVMSFPFWKVQNVYIFMDEIVNIIEKNGFIIESLLPRELGMNTKNGSLLYRRESQNVGREIIKILKK